MAQDKKDVLKGRVPAAERLLEGGRAPEQPREMPQRAEEEKAARQPEAPPAVQPKIPTPPPLPRLAKEPVLAQIEAILEEDLAEVYSGLPEELKPRFRGKGEEVAHAIREMMERAKVKARKVLKLIRQWLLMIPGVNKFFLEQETAIKTQKILGLSKKQE